MNSMEFAQMRVDGAPPAWGAAVYPYTFVITKNDRDQYIASARDARFSPFNPAGRIDLGSDFVTLQAAQEACREFVRSKWQ